MKSSVEPSRDELIPSLIRTRQRNLQHINIADDYPHTIPGWQESRILCGLPTAAAQTVVLNSVQSRVECWDHLQSLHITMGYPKSWLDLLLLLIAHKSSLKYLYVDGRERLNIIGNDLDVRAALIEYGKRHNAPEFSSPIALSLKKIVFRGAPWLLPALPLMNEVILIGQLKTLSFVQCDGAAMVLGTLKDLGITLSELFLVKSGSTGDIDACLKALPPTLKALHLNIIGSVNYPSRSAIERHASSLKRLWVEPISLAGEAIIMQRHRTEYTASRDELNWKTVVEKLKLEEFCAPLDLASLENSKKLLSVSPFYLTR